MKKQEYCPNCQIGLNSGEQGMGFCQNCNHYWVQEDIIKVGTVLVAIDACRMDGGYEDKELDDSNKPIEESLTIGKEYIITEVGGNFFCIIDDLNEELGFSIEDYTNFFKLKYND